MSNKKRKATAPVVIDLTGNSSRNYTRKRSYYGRRKRSYWKNLGRWERRTFPRSQYGKMYIPRTDATKGTFGRTWRLATDEQKKQRKLQRYVGDGMYTGSGLYTGQGGFWDNLKTGLLDTAQTAATAYNPLLGMGVGALRKATGIGPYSTASSNHIVNAGKGTSMNDNLPVRVQEPSETGKMIVSHTEFVSNVYAPSSNQFSKQVYDVNPGLESTFKWLSSIAGQYKEYSLTQCIFSFKSTVSDMQTTNGVIGKVMMGSEYNVGDKTATYDTAQELMADIGSVSNKITNGLVFGIECDPDKLKEGGSKKLIKYVRTRGLRQHQNIEDFDWARLTIATSDVPQILFDQCIGELHVTYTLELMRPTIKGLMGGNISQSLFCRDDTVASSVAFCGNGGLAIDTTSASLCESTSNMIDIKLGNPTILESSNYQVLETFGTVDPIINPANCQLSVIPIIFPAQVEGTYKVKLVIRLDNPGGGTVPLDGVKLWKKGNVHAIRDVPTGLLSGAQPPPISSPNIHCSLIAGDPYGYLLISVEAHVRVQEATGGSDNLVAFQFSCADQDPNPTIGNQYISVSEYNVEFNEEATGRPEWVNVQSKQKILTTAMTDAI